MARKLLVLIAVVVPLTFAACGGDDDEDTTAASSDSATTEESTTTGASDGGGETITISETDFALDPSEASTKAGTVTFDVVNNGGTLHNLEIEGNGVEEVSDDIEPGQSTQLSVDLGAGEYEMYCAIGNHRDLGMEGTISVEG